MTRTQMILTVVLVLALVAGLGFILHEGGDSEPVSRPASRAASDAPIPSRNDISEKGKEKMAVEAPVRIAPAPSAALPDEAALMARLRGLGQTNPELSLELAREGNQRFAGSADAPERAHIIVKSLVNLQRFEEAREEAKLMGQTYKDTPWALDVERHLLVNPLTHPSERGYGRERE